MTLLDGPVLSPWELAARMFEPPSPPVPRELRWATPGELAKELDPRTVRTPALDLIDAALVDVADGRCERLMISLAPQEGKSQRTSRRFPEFMLHRNPDTRIAIVSYAHGVARRWGRYIRDDIKMHGDRLGLAVDPNSAAAHEWDVDGRDGSVYCVGIRGSLTSKPVDLLIIDDPYKDREAAESDAWKETIEDFYTDVAIPRLGPGVAVVIIQTRWTHDDLTGWRLKEDGPDHWRVINIPAQADHRPEKGETDPLGREPGQYMESSRRRTTADWEKKKKEVGAESWLALYQGKPNPAAGNIFDRSWWQFYQEPQWVERGDGSRLAIGFDELIQSWDMTFKDSAGTDYVCGQVWGRRGADAYLLDQVHDRMDFVTTCLKVRTLSGRWPQPAAKLVEDKANGPAVINALRRTVAGLIAVEPDGSKRARAAAVSPFVQAGNVFLPEPALAPWVDEVIEECAGFPLSSHDDRVDALSQGLNRLLLNPILTEDTIVEEDDEDYTIGPSY